MAALKLVLFVSLLVGSVLFVSAQDDLTSTTELPSSSELPSSTDLPSSPEPSSTESSEESSSEPSSTADTEESSSEPSLTETTEESSSEPSLTETTEESSSISTTSSEPPPPPPGNSTLPPLPPPHGNSTHPPPPPPPHGNSTHRPPPPPHGNSTHPPPPPRPPHPLHNLTIGHRVEGDKLVLQQNITVPSKHGRPAFLIRTFIASGNNITQVQVTNLDHKPFSSIVKRIGGGPGKSSVTLLFKSLRRGRGLKFYVSLFAI